MHVAIVGSNERSGGAECVVFGHVGRRDGRFVSIERAADSGEFSPRGGWERREMRPGPDVERAPALVGAEIGRDILKTSGRLIVVSHRWSGVLQVDDIGRKYEVDLYAHETRLLLLDLVHEAVADVTALARVEAGALRLPDLRLDALAGYVAEGRCSLRLLTRNAAFRPGLARRAIEAYRARAAERTRLTLLSAAFAAAPLSAPPPAPASPRWLDEMRFLTAALDGLAARAASAA